MDVHKSDKPNGLDKYKHNFLFRYPLSFSFYIFIFFIVGVALSFAYKNIDCIPKLLTATIIILVLGIIAVLFLRFTSVNMIIIAFVVSTVALFSGYTYTSAKYRDTFQSPIEHYENSTSETVKGFKAKVISYDGLNVNRHVYTVNVDELYDGTNKHYYNSKIRLYSYNDYIFGENDIITSTAKLWLYKDIFTNGTAEEANIISMLEKKSLVGVASSYSYNNIVLIKEGFSIANYLGEFFTPLRIFIKEALASNMESINYSIAQCILIGDKHTLQYSIEEIFQRVGISHILSVSGLHLSIVYFLLFSLLLIFRIPFHYRLVATTLCIIVVYLPVTLFAIPILRASIMMLIATIAILFDRTRNVLNILLLTAFILIVYNPDIIKEISFQFSFLATFSLVIYMPMLAKLIKPLPAIVKVIIDFFAVSIIANIILLPLASHYFGTVTLTSILANIYAVPITFAIIVLDIVIVILYAIKPSLASLPSALNNTLVDMMMVFSRWLGDKDIWRWEYRMGFNRAIMLTVVMIVVSLVLYYLFHKKQFRDLIK